MTRVGLLVIIQTLVSLCMLGLASYCVHTYLNNGLLVRVFYGNAAPVLPPTPAPTPALRGKHG